ncbi:hypothetical protein CLF_105219 [Clonorchis sinensis]|uniref:Uncharacterized protein n=1 Tax=Clonorchis sinensis TaxID=79923 RepID=G7YD81_CLOSI|nr:hypothetical protein CLF_105219 [Clonorchis sinensis]
MVLRTTSHGFCQATGYQYRDAEMGCEDLRVRIIQRFIFASPMRRASSYFRLLYCTQGAFTLIKAPRMMPQRVYSGGRFAAALTEVVQQSAWAQHVAASTKYRTCPPNGCRRRKAVIVGLTAFSACRKRVQRAATKMIADLQSMGYGARLVALGRFPPEYCQLRGDLTVTFALLEQGLANRFFAVDPADTRRRHVAAWNNLPPTVAHAISNIQFKARLDAFMRIIALTSLLFCAENVKNSATPFFVGAFQVGRRKLYDANGTLAFEVDGLASLTCVRPAGSPRENELSRKISALLI